MLTVQVVRIEHRRPVLLCDKCGEEIDVGGRAFPDYKASPGGIIGTLTEDSTVQPEDHFHKECLREILKKYMHKKKI